MRIAVAESVVCFHCGEHCDEVVFLNERPFCCVGCKSVLEILNENNLCNYYTLEKNAGVSQRNTVTTLYDYLDDPLIRKKIISFDSQELAKVSFNIPSIHCTTSHTDLLIALGASAISDGKYAYAQNLKKVEDYIAAVKERSSAVFKGHVLSEEDMMIKECISQISCNGELSSELLQRVTTPQILDTLVEMEEEGILYLYEGGMKVTTAGEPFIRNICAVFDMRLDNHSKSLTFSKAI